jgi:uncharacterized protein YbjT (DUF2867 family)
MTTAGSRSKRSSSRGPRPSLALQPSSSSRREFAVLGGKQPPVLRRIVFSGVDHPSLSLVNHASVRPVEESAYQSDLEFTILQPPMFMQGLLGSWQSAVEHGLFGMPYSKDSAMTFVDYRDVAEAAAIAFTTDDLVNGTFELAASGMATRSQQTAAACCGACDPARRQRSTSRSSSAP